MLEEAKKVFLAGVGAAAMTYDKSVEVVEMLVEKGKITVEDGKELSEELKRDVKEKAESVKLKANEKIEGIRPITKDDMAEILKEFNFVTREEILELKNKIAELEAKLGSRE